jgi:hypothetical protein
MSDDTMRLPPLKIPNALHELLRIYAFKNKMSVSEAVRDLLKKSPGLIEIAKQEGVNLDDLVIGSWGGRRQVDEQDEDEEPSMAIAVPSASRLPAPIMQGWQGKPVPKPGQKGS